MNTIYEYEINEEFLNSFESYEYSDYLFHDDGDSSNHAFHSRESEVDLSEIVEY